MAIVNGSDPVELRVLSALTAGASTVLGVAAEVGEPESVVEPILEGSVAEQTTVRLDLPGLPTYALTPKGLALLGLSPDPQAVADDASDDHVSSVPDDARRAAATDDAPRDAAPAGAALTEEPLAPVAPMGLGPGTASGGTSVSTDPTPSPRVRRRHVVYAVGYVVVGLLLLTVTPILGGLAMLAGLALGGFALRPLFTSSSTRVNGP